MLSQENKPDRADAGFSVLVLMPTGRDAELVLQTLESAGLSGKVCDELAHLEFCLDENGGTILLAEEALHQNGFNSLIEIVEKQPVWSDIPLILLAANQRNSESLLKTIGSRLNITILERPLPKAILISSVRSALRARKKQYQTRDLLTQLKEADRQKDLFLATLSHELRTPLNSMVGWIELLRSNRKDFDQNHALEVIERNAKAQTQIIQDILLLSRVVTGKFEIERKSINLIEVLQAAIEVVLPLIKAKNIKLQTEFDDSANSIEGDFDRLRQVFWNLLTNAVKFTPNFGTISISTKRKDSRVIISFSDTGQGIEPEFIPFVFERFRQANNNYSRGIGGLGLGLSIVQTIVELHGGSVSAESDGKGHGTMFLVELPLMSDTSENITSNIEKIIPQSELSFAGLKVLIAEDDDDSREMLIFLLKQHQFKIEAVSNAADALMAISNNPPNLIISDVGMPEMDGYELIRRVRQFSAEKGGQVPAIALTGYASQQDRTHSIEAGYQAHLSKPIDFDEFFETIKKVLQDTIINR